VTYADDLVILCRRGKAAEALQRLREIMGKLKLTVNEEKTRICKVPEGEFDFLGPTPVVTCKARNETNSTGSLTERNLATLKDRVQRVPAIASAGTHLAWPATCLSRLRPIQAGKDVWTVNFIHGTVRRAFVDDSPRAVSDDQFKVSP
jgi:hypothetical protein